MRTKELYLECTLARHKQLGTHAVINAAAGMAQLNSLSLEDVEMMRDKIKLEKWRERRVIFRQWNSRFFRRNAWRFPGVLYENE